MGFPETGIGIYPGLGGTQRTTRIVGKELAKYLIFTGKVLSPEEAQAIGVVDYIVEPNEIDRKIHAMADLWEFSSRKEREHKDLPEDWKRIQRLFADDHIEGWLSGKYLKDDDLLVAKKPYPLPGHPIAHTRVAKGSLYPGHSSGKL